MDQETRDILDRLEQSVALLTRIAESMERVAAEDKLKATETAVGSMLRDFGYPDTAIEIIDGIACIVVVFPSRFTGSGRQERIDAAQKYLGNSVDGIPIVVR